jgi:hypothetical protein
MAEEKLRELWERDGRMVDAKIDGSDPTLTRYPNLEEV